MRSIIIEVSSQTCILIDLILYLDETEEKISEDGTLDELNHQTNQTFRRTNLEPSPPTFIPPIFPKCKNGVFECEEINSDRVLDESCKGILQFTNSTSFCSCNGTNDSARNSEPIKKGWSKFTRYI